MNISAPLTMGMASPFGSVRGVAQRAEGTDRAAARSRMHRKDDDSTL